MLTLHLPDEPAMRAFGAMLMPLLKAGDVVALHGGLGAGKTTLARGLIQALCGPQTEVPSPTYTLVQTYETSAFMIWHYDLYRLEDPADLVELAWEDTAQGVAIVEWPVRAGGALPVWRLDVHIQVEGDGRTVMLEPHGEDWQARIHDDSFRYAR